MVSEFVEKSLNVFGEKEVEFKQVECNTWKWTNNSLEFVLMPLPFLDGTAERRPTQCIACARQPTAGEQLVSRVFLCGKGPTVNEQ